MNVVEFDFAIKAERAIQPAEVAKSCSGGKYCWLDAGEGDAGELKELLTTLGIGQAVVEEVLGTDRHGRYDMYPDCLHFSLTEAHLEKQGLETAHLDVLLAERFLVTFHRRNIETVTQMRRTYSDDFTAFSKSPGFLLYELGDHLIDTYRRTLRAFADSVEQIQLNLFGEIDDGIFRHVSDLNSNLLVFRRMVLAARDVFHEMASRRSRFVSETTQPHLDLLASRLVRLGDDLTMEREVLTETLSLYMGMVSHRTNKIVNRLTVISAIFLPLAFLCGVYGMNFDIMPELKWKYGYLLFWLVAAGIAVTLLVYMKRRRWI